MLPVFDFQTMTADEVRKFISIVESSALEMPEDRKIEVPIFNHFSKGVYAREMRMKKGELIVGKIHKHQNLNILSAGEVSVLSVDGVKRIKAPHTFVASPGAKRVIYCHEDCVWTVIHGTDLKDVDKIEEEFIAKSYDEVIESKEVKCLG